MEAYILDSLLRRQTVVDKFESFIWTERFAAFGDFEIVIRSTLDSRTLFKPGVRIAMNKSYRVMTVETVEDSVTDDGRAILTVKGNSLEAMLQDRVAKNIMAGVATWDITAAPAEVMRKIFHDICVTGVLDPLDKIPFIFEQSVMPANNIVEPPDPITVNLKLQTVYAALLDIAKVWTLGFRILRTGDDGKLYWDVYSGSDRTSVQRTRPPVIFSPELDNLTNTTELNTIESSKNVAYVFSPSGFVVVYPKDVAPDIDGFDRRVLLVDANDITTGTAAEINAALLQRGKEELSKNMAFKAFDGEININSQYVYEKDYYLGDLIEQRNIDDVGNQMRVTEQIFVSDGAGERAYPTLAVNQYVNTGSWLSWQASQQWIDLLNNPITWSEQA